MSQTPKIVASQPVNRPQRNPNGAYLIRGTIPRGKHTHRLVLTDFVYGEYRILLGQGIPSLAPGEADKIQKGQGANTLISFIPLVFTTPDLKRENASTLTEGSYLYVYRNGKLFREMAVLKSGSLSDVNLHAMREAHKGKLPDRRKATCAAEECIIVPHKVKGEEQIIELAVSPVQWSAAYIEALEQDGAKREARMQRMDFSNYAEKFSGSKNLCNIDAAHYAANGDTKWLKLFKGGGMGVAYLQDPVGVALRQGEQMLELYAQLQGLVNQAKVDPYYHSAVIAYQLFFNQEVQNKGKRNSRIGTAVDKALRGIPMVNTIVAEADWISRLTGHGPAVSNGVTKVVDQTDPIVRTANDTDRDKLETTLKIKERKPLREQIRKLKQLQADWLDGKYQGQPVQAADRFIPFDTAIIDAFTLGPRDYRRAWQIMSDVCGGLSFDPSDLDADITLPEERQRTPDDQDPGVRHLLALLEKSHPLNPMLFPTEAQCPVTSDAKPDLEVVKNDGSGAFRPQDFDPRGFRALGGKIDEKDNGNDGRDIVAGTIDTLGGAAGHFASHYTRLWEQWQKQLQASSKASDSAQADAHQAGVNASAQQGAAVDAEKITLRMTTLTRGLKAADLEHFRYLRITTMGKMPTDYVILGLRVLETRGSVAQSQDGKNQTASAGAVGANSAASQKDSAKTGSTGAAEAGWEWPKDVYMQSMEAVILPREVAIALDLDYADPARTMADTDAAQARADADAAQTKLHKTPASAAGYQQARQNFEQKQTVLQQRQSELERIDAQTMQAFEARRQGQRLESFATGAKTVMLLFNAWNTLGAYEAWSKDRSLEKYLEFGNAGGNLLYATGDIVESLFKGNEAVAKFMQATIPGTRIRWFPGLGAALAALGLVLAVRAAVDAYEAGNPGEAVAQGVVAVGMGLTFLNQAASSVVRKAATTAATVFVGEAAGESVSLFMEVATGPIGWIGGGVVLLGTVLIAMMKDTDLDRWAKNGPFANAGTPRDAELAWLGEGGMKDKAGNVDGFPAFEYLMGVLFTPSLAIDHVQYQAGRPPQTCYDLVIRLGLPALFPNAIYELHVEIKGAEARYVNPQDYVGYNPTAKVNVSPMQWPLMPRLPGQGERPISRDKQGELTRNVYYPALPNPFRHDSGAAGGRIAQDKSLAGVDYRYRAKARLTAGHLTFPVMPRDAQGKRIYVEPPADDPQIIHIDEPGWVYALAAFDASRKTAACWSAQADIRPEPPKAAKQS